MPVKKVIIKQLPTQRDRFVVHVGNLFYMTRVESERVHVVTPRPQPALPELLVNVVANLQKSSCDDHYLQDWIEI